MLLFYASFTGYFMYIETSKPRKEADYAVLQSKLFLSYNERCFQFYYHMFGNPIGTLQVIYSPHISNNDVKIWEKSQNQGNQWHLARVNLTSDLANWGSPYKVSCQFANFI